MENFIVSARKYRPQTFETVVGQHSITSTLKNAIRNKQLAQAFLFTGPRGVGKTTCARIFAKTINCTNLSDNFEPCDQCESCTSFNKSASFNIHELDAASNNSVEDIRRLVEQVRIPPQVGSYKVYIIDEVHMLSQAAFNAFLKTLEEPPTYAKFILATTEKHKIIPTILSRCQIYDFNRITLSDITNHLMYVADKENVGYELSALHVIAQKADGALRDALSIFDQIVSFTGGKITYQETIDNLNVLDVEFYFQMVNHFLQGDISSSLLILDKIISKGFDGHHFINGLASHIRNLLVGKDAATIKLLETSDDIKEMYVKQAQYCGLNFLVKSLDICNKVDLNYKIASNKRLLIEIALMEMCALNKAFGNEKTELPEFVTKPNPSNVSPVTQPISQPVQKSAVVSTPVPVPVSNSVVTDTVAKEVEKAVPQSVTNVPIAGGDKKAEISGGTSLIGNFKSARTISIKDTLSAEEKAETEKINYEAEANKSFDTVKVKLSADQIWSAIEAYKEENGKEFPAQNSALNREKFSVGDKNDITLIVNNPKVFEAVDKFNFLVWLKERLNNSEISMETVFVQEKFVNPDNPKEIFNRMVEQNPEVQDFTSSLGLLFEQ